MYDLDCYSSVAQYQIAHSVAMLLWEINRALLILVYQLDHLRAWLVKVAFTGAYAALARVIDPLLIPAATIAVLAACMLFLVLPLLGRIQLINVRQAMVWAALAPLLLAQAGSALASVEDARTAIGNRIFMAVQTDDETLTAVFGANAADLDQPQPLYPSGACGVQLARATLTTDGEPSTLRMDDLAAGLLYADASDIHCPQQQRYQTPPELPHRFFERQPDGPGYAYAGDLSAETNQQTRQGYVTAAQRGITRLATGLLPTTLAVVDALIQLVATLCLAAIWVGFAVSLPLVFFQQDLSILLGLIKRAGRIIVTSWVISFMLGLVFAFLLGAARSGSAGAYTGFAIGGLIVAVWMLATIAGVFKESLAALGTVAGSATGMAASIPMAIAGSAGGAAVAGAMALRQSANAASGHIRPVAAVGEVAAGMGGNPSAVEHGLLATREGADPAAMLRRFHTDAQKPDDDGQPSIRQRATEERQRSAPAEQQERVFATLQTTRERAYTRQERSNGD